MIGTWFGIVIIAARAATRLWRVPVSGLSDSHIEWLKARGIEKDTASDHGLTSRGPGIAIPYTVAGEYRYSKIIDPTDKSKTRCHPSGVDQTSVWNHDCLFDDPQPEEFLVITEGECLPGETEVLTPSGWVRLDAFRGGVIAQPHAGGRISWTAPLAKVEKHFSGSLLRYEGRDLSITTTPSHNVVAVRGGQWIKQRASDVYAFGDLPRSGTIDDGPGIGLTREQIAICLAVAADASIDVRKQSYAGGSARNLGRESRYARLRFKKDRKIARLEALLNAAGLPFSKSTQACGGTFFGVPLPDWVPGRSLPWSWIADATNQEREFILAELVHWDGNHVPNRTQHEFATRIKEQADFVQALCHLSGRCSSIMGRTNDFGSWHKVSVLHGKRHSSWQMAKRGAIEVPFDGTVYCLQMPSGYLMVRQEGDIHITGNCDALTVLQEGQRFVVSVPSGTQDSADGARKKALRVFTSPAESDGAPVLKPEFEKFKRIAVLADGDRAGLFLRDALIEIFGDDYCWVPTYPEGTKDANDVLKKHGRAGVRDLITGLKPVKDDGFVTFSEALKTTTPLKPLNHGIAFLRPHFRPVRPSFIVVGSQANHGKSSCIQALVYNLLWANPDLKASFYFAEGDRSIPPGRAMSFWRGIVNPVQFTDQHKREREFWVGDRLAYIKPPQDQPPTFEWLMWAMERQVLARGRNVFVIDPWNQVLHTANFRSKTDYIGDCIYQMKRLADRHNLILIVAHHTTKEIDEHKPPNRYQLADSAHWVNAADHVLMLWRKPGEVDRTRLEVAKSKDFHVMGTPGTVWVRLGDPFNLSQALDPNAPKDNLEEPLP
jgi:hypothetical protein